MLNLKMADGVVKSTLCRFEVCETHSIQNVSLCIKDEWFVNVVYTQACAWWNIKLYLKKITWQHDTIYTWTVKKTALLGWHCTKKRKICLKCEIFKYLFEHFQVRFRYSSRVLIIFSFFFYFLSAELALFIL